MRRHGLRASWGHVIGAAVFVAALLPAGAGAQTIETIGAPDLSGPPDDQFACGEPVCTITGNDPGEVHPFQAPADGRITEVRFRTQEQHAATGVRILTAPQFPNLLFGNLFPLGPAPALPFGQVHVFQTDIPVVETEILALELTGGPQALDLYTLKGATTAAYEPALNTGQSGPPDQKKDDRVPAVQFKFEMVRPPLPEEEGGKPPPPPPSADVAVSKTFTGKYGFAQIGGTAPFYVLVENRGPSTAQGVVLRDSIGGGVRFDRAKTLKGSAVNAKCAAKKAAVVCNLGALAPGAKVGIDFFFHVRGKSSKGAGKGSKRREENKARVSSTGPPDPNPKNNVARARARILSGGASCPARGKVGTPRNDRMKGTRRSETMVGFAGNDRIQAKRGRDCLFGDSGRDVLVGGPDPDYIEGGAGNDKVFAADGEPDKIRCGPGRRDAVVADRRGDRVARDCERVRRR